LRPFQRTLVGGSQELSYAGVVKTDVVELPLDFALQRIFLDIYGTMDITVGVSVLVEDALQSLIGSLKIELTGDTGTKTVVAVSGSDLYIKNFFDYHQAASRVTYTAIANGNLVELGLVIDFRLARNDPDDFSVAIPLFALSNASLIVDWVAAATGYGTNTSNWALTGKITLFEGIPESAEERTALRANPLLTYISREFTLEADLTEDELRDRDIAIGNLITRIFVISKSNAGAKSDLQIADYTFETATRVFFKGVSWRSSKLQDKFDYDLENLSGNVNLTGVTIIDFARQPVDESGNVIGFNARGLKSGDIKLSFKKLVASPKMRYIQEQVEG
jgi:hypothetical protein